MAAMVKIYDLRNDERTIRAIQGATLNTKKYGLRPDHGLFGSQEWWLAIKSGAVPKQMVDGTISRVYMSGHNDFPQFDMTTDDGRTTSWIREGDDKHYIVGKRAKIIYVLQKFRQPSEYLNRKGRKTYVTDSEQVLEIWIEK